MAVWEPHYDCAAMTEVPPAECRALATFFWATDGSFWRDHADWLQTSTPCSWFGVACAADHVTELSLPGNDLVDSLPAAMGDLGALERLDLHGNRLSGALPPGIGNLAALQLLDPSANRLTGPLPASLGNLRSLRTLNLAQNELTGSLSTEVGNLPALQRLDLSGNALSGWLPSSLGQLSQLQHIDLSHNLFTGTLLWNYWRMAYFPELRYLDFSHNQLISLLPAGLGSWPQLTHLDLSYNRFDDGIPWDLGDAPRLEYLNLAGNLLGGSIPPVYGGLETLQELDLSDNYLEGPLSPELGQLRSLARLDLHHNLLSGPLPPELAQVGQDVAAGVDIDLAGNHFIGAAPAELAEHPALHSLQLSGNQLSGVVPAAVEERLREVADLNYNQLVTAEPRWRFSQTVPPGDLKADAAGEAVTLTWTRIPYQNDGGFYEISYATARQGSWQVHGYTVNKWYESYAITGLAPDTPHYFRVRTFTPAHAYKAPQPVATNFYVQPNNLWSDYTPVVCVNCEAEPGGARLLLPLLAR